MGDLEAERRNIKELFVLHQGDLRQVRQQEQDRAQALVCDLKTKLNNEKIAELNKQKEKLTKDHEVEMIKMTKEHQDQVWKLSTDKKKEKEQIVKNLWDSRKTEDQKHAALLTELGKITQELHDVRSEKLRLEIELGSLTNTDKQKALDLKRLAEEHEREVQRIRNENRREVKRIMEEVKSKEKQMSIMQRELGNHLGQLAQAQIEKESIEGRLESEEGEEGETLKEEGGISNEASEFVAGRSAKCSGSKIPVLKRKSQRQQQQRREQLQKEQQRSDEGTPTGGETKEADQGKGKEVGIEGGVENKRGEAVEKSQRADDEEEK